MVISTYKLRGPVPLLKAMAGAVGSILKSGRKLCSACLAVQSANGVWFFPSRKWGPVGSQQFFNGRHEDERPPTHFCSFQALLPNVRPNRVPINVDHPSGCAEVHC